jgi:hypothetical protein
MTNEVVATHVAQTAAASTATTAMTRTPPVSAAALIPSESSSALADTTTNAKPKVAFAATARPAITASGSIGGSAAPLQTQAQAAAAAAATNTKRRGPFRSQSMGAIPTGGKPPMAPASVDPHERFYPPALRKRDSLGESSTTGSFIDELAPSLGALRNRFSASQRRRSFAGSTAHSRRQSLEEVTTVREDFVFKAGAGAPLLPERLLPMISHGMARLAINMKDEAMTPATWEVVLSVLKVCCVCVPISSQSIHTKHLQMHQPKQTPQPEDAAKVKRYRFDKDKRLALGSQLLQRAVVAWTFGVPYRDILIARTGKFVSHS